MTTPKKRPLDIKTTLSAIDSRDAEYYARLDDEAKKGFVGLVVLRWASIAYGSRDMSEYTLMSINERANHHHFELVDHPELQYRLMASTGTGIQSRHGWLPMAKKDRANTAIGDFVRRYYPEANSIEVDIVINHLRQGNNLDEFLSGTGMQYEDVKSIKALFA